MAGRLTLAQQLKQLEDDAPMPFGADEIDNGDLGLDGLSIPKDREGGREHYLDVGPSRLRQNGGGAAQTLLGDKYGGEVRRRMKIFDDDEDEDEEEDGREEDENRAFGEVESDDEDEDEEDEDDGESEEEEDQDDGIDEEEEEEDNEEDDVDDEEEQAGARNSSSRKGALDAEGSNSKAKVLDPMAALKDARSKDIEKGKAIKLQKKLFEDILTLRITFQKAWTASLKLPQPLPSPEDSESELAVERQDTLRKLSDLSEQLFEMRSNLSPLPGAPSAHSITKKRKRPDQDEVLDEEYWEASAQESLVLSEASRPAINGILEKWSNKIQVATMQLGGKGAGSSKFLQSAKGQMGILEAIEAGLASKRESEKTFEEHEDASYRALLREVIESRAGGGAGPDLTHLRKEKKKKREEERGGSKGRKIRYTVHEKAQNFVVPIPLSHGWHEEQVDELFSSLFGGVGMSGASSEAVVAPEINGGSDGLAGLRVF